ncbi:MAG: hypothetical protein LBJ74_05075 [Heliobacteriaceae bacterium]|jgi:hypothetical protein|nr:hypothetical protein [Heliobacteriaceae bacterium]
MKDYLKANITQLTHLRANFIMVTAAAFSGTFGLVFVRHVIPVWLFCILLTVGLLSGFKFLNDAVSVDNRIEELLRRLEDGGK